MPPPACTAGVLVDTNGDGFADSTGYDTTGDGVIDALDTNSDGQIDTAIVVQPAPNSSLGDGSAPHIPLNDYLDEDEQASWAAELADQVYDIIDADQDGQVSKLELLAAMVRNQTVDDFILPGFDSSRALTDEKSFDAVSAVFDAISCGQARISRTEFVEYFGKTKGKAVADKSNEDNEQLRSAFDLIDADGKGTFSNFDLLGALQRFPAVADLLLPGVDRRSILRDEKHFDAANAVWDAMAGGRRRVDFWDFASYFRKTKSQSSLRGKPHQSAKQSQRGNHGLNEDDDVDMRHPATKLPSLASQSPVSASTTDSGPTGVGVTSPKPTLLQSLRSKPDSKKCPCKPHRDRPRHEKSVLIIGPGFGREINPAQAALVHQAGFQIQYVEVPNPEQPSFPISAYLPLVKEAIDKYMPDVVVAASKGGPYVVALWKKGWWKGPTVMINAHPQMTELPKDATVVIAHGSNDELYTRSRAELEQLVSTGSQNRCFLYYTANSGHFSKGYTRLGDKHNMASLLQYDCLPRLIDAASCDRGPELHMVASWRQRLSPQRDEAEHWLTHCPEQLRDLWESTDHMGLDARKLYEVPRHSEEFIKVATIFKSAPPEPPAYTGTSDFEWGRTGILRIERVENGLLEQSENAYYESMRRSIEDQGLTFEPGVHTRWAFHGTDQIESIIEDPMMGFQPLACGTRLGSLWGSGTYFARDARYVVDGNFCPVQRDGTRQMLLCLLMTGMPCLGDPNQHGVLPFRRKPHRYHSSVDSLSSPEIFITQHPGAAYPAYLITFA